MRILFLTNADVHQFGIAEALHGLSSALVRQGVSVLCYSPDPSAKLSPLPNGVSVAFGPLPAPRFFPSSRDVRTLLRLCEREAIDVIHCHNVYRPGWAARLVKRALGIPYVLTSHNDVNPHTSARIRRFWVRRRCRMILRDAALITHLNTFMQENARRLGSVDDKSRTIPNGLDLSRWQESTADPGSRIVLALGRLVKDKGFDTLIEAAGLLKSRDIPMSLVIAGAGPEQARLATLARQRGLAVHEGGEPPVGQHAVWFPGVVADEAKRRLFARCRIVAFPSHAHSEAFGLVVLEAMAAGRPVLASDIPSVREVLGAGSEQLAPPRDAAAWASRLSRWLADDALCRSLGDANRQHVRRYDWNLLARDYMEAYRLALQTASRSSPRTAVRG